MARSCLPPPALLNTPGPSQAMRSCKISKKSPESPGFCGEDDLFGGYLAFRDYGTMIEYESEHCCSGSCVPKSTSRIFSSRLCDDDELSPDPTKATRKKEPICVSYGAQSPPAFRRRDPSRSLAIHVAPRLRALTVASLALTHSHLLSTRHPWRPSR